MGQLFETFGLLFTPTSGHTASTHHCTLSRIFKTVLSSEMTAFGNDDSFWRLFRKRFTKAKKCPKINELPKITNKLFYL